MRQCLFALICLATIGCGSGRGFTVTPDGRLVDNSAESAREHAVANLAGRLRRELGRHGRAEIAIAELPEYVAGDRRLEEGWYWKRATVTVEIVEDGVGRVAIDDDAIATLVRARMREALRSGDDDRVTISVRHAVDGARFAELRPLTAPPRAATVGKRTYVVQSGDTLADISLAFYGSARHWRAILPANPWLDPEMMKPGDVLVIPEQPAD
ncbi:MAG: LysM peptidoglycan-binding domain-containing protein [Planctomycetes bacterium]|nr:LysM peptidoglycan-binding domain-containing protein [Planctomycetota bacterium]